MGLRPHSRWALAVLVWAFVFVSGLIAFPSQEADDAESRTLLSGEDALAAMAYAECLFLANPMDYVVRPDADYRSVSDITTRISSLALATSDFPETVDPATIPRKNLIDDSIFNRMAMDGIGSAPLASDAEYLRRVFLDLIGRIPPAAVVESFLANPNPAKRDAIVDVLINRPEFVDRWTMFFGDLFKNTAFATNVIRFAEGRDAFYLYLREAIGQGKPYDQLARELITATGDSFENGAVNWTVGHRVPMGPPQDTFDGAAVNLASTFLGINAVDCLLCHDGAGHLEEVNLWGASETRLNMWGLSAFFARTRAIRDRTSDGFVRSYIVRDAPRGEYLLNTTSGNRSARYPIDFATVVEPKNPFAETTRPATDVFDSASEGSGILPGETRREAIARQITGDIQFARAAVNYIWEELMVEAFVSPSNSFDLARLDPAAPPPEPWGLQPTNPELLNQLALWFQQSGYDLRSLIGLIVKSNAYGLSSTYPGTWEPEFVPYYARKYVRRLDSEEIHDSIAMATNVPGFYRFRGSLGPVQWAMQLPDTREPRGNPVVANFLNAFGRGDRDQNPRRSDASVIQSLTMMNSDFVMRRIDASTRGSRVSTLLGETSDPRTLIRQLHLHTLSRPATEDEIALFMPMFQQLGPREGAESLQWILLNRLQFLFNY